MALNRLTRLALGTLPVLMIVTAPVFAENENEREGDSQPVTYCVYDIGRLAGLPPGERSLDLRAINNRNQIVGWTALAGVPPLHAFIWDRKRGMRDLGSLQGHASVTPSDINEAGTVVGDALDFETGDALPFIWTKRTGMQALEVSLGGVRSFATGINRSGQVVGGSETATGAFHAFLRDVNGDVLDLGAFPDGSGNSSATALNDRARVVGSRGDGQILEGFVWDEHTGMRPLRGAADGRFPIPHDINNRGEVVGELLGVDPTRAFRWTRKRGVQDLGSLAGLDTDFATAKGINGSGVIVGGSQTTGGLVHGFVWSRQAGMRDLNELIDPASDIPSQAVLGGAVGINDSGSIALVGFVPGESEQRGFFLLPRRDFDTGCP